MPAGGGGARSAAVGPAEARIAPTGMATAPYLSVVHPPTTTRPVAPLITTDVPPDAPSRIDAADLFTAPTTNMPVTAAQATGPEARPTAPETPQASAADIFSAPTAVLPTQSAPVPAAAVPADEIPPHLPTDPATDA